MVITRNVEIIFDDILILTPLVNRMRKMTIPFLGLKPCSPEDYLKRRNSGSPRTVIPGGLFLTYL